MAEIGPELVASDDPRMAAVATLWAERSGVVFCGHALVLGPGVAVTTSEVAAQQPRSIALPHVPGLSAMTVQAVDRIVGFAVLGFAPLKAMEGFRFPELGACARARIRVYFDRRSSIWRTLGYGLDDGAGTE